MADLSTMAGPGQYLETSATNAVCTVTIPGPTSPGQVLYLDGYLISASAAPAAAVIGTITGLATTQHINIPASAFVPFGYLAGLRPLPASGAQAIVISIPALGSGVVCTVQAYYHYQP